MIMMNPSDDISTTTTTCHDDTNFLDQGNSNNKRKNNNKNNKNEGEEDHDHPPMMTGEEVMVVDNEFHWCSSSQNRTDILSKHWDYMKVKDTVRELFAYQGDIILLKPH